MHSMLDKPHKSKHKTGWINRCHTPSKNLYTLFTVGFVDHYDTALYGFLAPTLAPLFFPSQKPLTSLILAYSSFLLAVFFRPLGGLFAYQLVTEKNLRKVLCLSLGCITLAMAGISILPSYGTIGLSAPLGLLFLRAILDFGVGIERALSKTTLIQEAPPHKALTFSTTYEIFSLAGLFLASLAPLIVLTWPFLSWRFCFFLGGFLTATLLVIRLKTLSNMPLPPRKTSAYAFLSLHKKTILRLSLANAFSYSTYVVPFLFLSIVMPWIHTKNATLALKLTPLLWIFDFFCLGCVYVFWQRKLPGQMMKWGIRGFLLSLMILPFISFLSTYTLLALRMLMVFSGVLFAVAFSVWKNQITPHDKNRFLSLVISDFFGATLFGRNLLALLLSLYHLTHRLSVCSLLLAFTTLAAHWAVSTEKKPLKKEV